MKAWSRLIHRVATRTRPSGALAAIEHPTAGARMSVLGITTSALMACVMTAMFMAFGEQLAAVVTITFAVALILTLAWQVWAPGGTSVRTIASTIIGSAAATHVALHLSLGGYSRSGGVLALGALSVMLALVSLSRIAVVAVTAGYCVGAIVLAAIEPGLVESRHPPDPRLTAILGTLVLITLLIMLAALLGYLLGRLHRERTRAEALLLNVLPAPIAGELKERGGVQPRRFESISVLFADIVGFTPWSATMSPEDVIAELDTMFTAFDAIADRHGCEKIRTIGDAYMVAAGVPVPRPDHARAIARIGLEMLAYGATTRFQFRIGINSGPAIAGVIGRRKFVYDVWGDTVNTASRMESHGIPGTIQITDATRRLLGDGFRGRPRGPVEVKGKGTMETWLLVALADT